MFKRVPWKRKRGGYVTPKGVQVHESESCRAELWLEYFKYGFEHRVRGSGVGTHPVGVTDETQKGCKGIENLEFSVRF